MDLVGPERIDEQLALAPDCPRDRLDPLDAGRARPLAQPHLHGGEAALELLPGALSQCLWGIPADPRVRRDGIAVLAAKDSVEWLAEVLAEQVPQGQIHACDRFGVEAGGVPAQPLAGVELLPQRLDLAGVLPDQNRRQQVIDHGGVHSRRRRRVALAPANQAFLRGDPDQCRLSRAPKSAGRSVVQAVPEPGASGGVPHRRHFDVPLRRLVPSRRANHQRFNASNLQRSIAARKELFAERCARSQPDSAGQEASAGAFAAIARHHQGTSCAQRNPRFGVRWLGRTQLRKKTVIRFGPLDQAPPRTMRYMPSAGPCGFSAGLDS